MDTGQCIHDETWKEENDNLLTSVNREYYIMIYSNNIDNCKLRYCRFRGTSTLLKNREYYTRFPVYIHIKVSLETKILLRNVCIV